MRTAIYPGTFDPVTRGHLSVIARGARMFDRLIVLIAVNPDKQPLFSPDERAQMIRQVTSGHTNVACDHTSGYVVAYAQAHSAQYLIRGVRGCTDVEAEIALANLNHALAPEIETVFVPAHPSLSEVSSSRLKALAQQGGDLSAFCPPELIRRLRERLRAPESERRHV